ncbi:MAG: hypothetical protein ACTS5I_10880, partial [Rhodanobacter sp.]
MTAATASLSDFRELLRRWLSLFLATLRRGSPSPPRATLFFRGFHSATRRLGVFGVRRVPAIACAYRSRREITRPPIPSYLPKGTHPDVITQLGCPRLFWRHRRPSLQENFPRTASNDA